MKYKLEIVEFQEIPLITILLEFSGFGLPGQKSRIKFFLLNYYDVKILTYLGGPLNAIIYYSPIYVPRRVMFQ